MTNPLLVVPTSQTGSGEGYEKPPAGNHPAVCVAIIDLGTHQEAFKGEEPKPVHKLWIVWELPGEKVSGYRDKNHTIAREFSLTMTPKSHLRQYVKQWFGKEPPDGKPFDPAVLLGHACLLNIIHTEKGYAQVNGIGPLPKGMPKPVPQNKGFVWFIGCGQDVPNQDWIPYRFGKPLGEYIRTATEYLSTPVGQPQQDRAEGGDEEAEAEQPADSGIPY